MAIKFIAAFGDWEVNTEISPIRGVASISYFIYMNKYYYGDIYLREKDNSWHCYIRNENDLFSSDDRQILIKMVKEYHEKVGKYFFRTTK